MKTSVEISEECQLEVSTIRNIINTNGIRGTYDPQLQKMFYDDHQVELIHHILFFECRIDHVIYKSKMNKR